MTKAEYRRNGTIIRTRYYDTDEQAKDALVKLSLRRWRKNYRTDPPPIASLMRNSG